MKRMQRNLLLMLALILFASACSSGTNPTAEPAPTVAPSVTPPAFRTEIPVSNTRTNRVAPTLAPTQQPTEIPSATPAATGTPPPTASPTSEPTLAPTTVAATAAPSVPTPTPKLAPAVYVTNLQVMPPQPKSKPAEFSFTVSFLNTVGNDVNYPRWRVLIYPQGTDKPTGDPEGLSKTIANGASTQDTKPWSVRVATACEPFVAQPIWEREDGVQVPLARPDGKPSTLEFQICP